jgi:hypothetical protein
MRAYGEGVVGGIFCGKWRYRLMLIEAIVIVIAST